MWFQEKTVHAHSSGSTYKGNTGRTGEKGRKMYVVFVDYSKAFDTTNRQILIRKLEMMIGNTRNHTS